MKINPCDKCLVTPCCSKICESKDEYTDEITSFLCRLGQHVFKKNGKRRRWGASKLLNTRYDETVVLCNRNQYQYNQIIQR